jgi:pimeloyl-ACP methyl ester carboxylesterase
MTSDPLLDTLPRGIRSRRVDNINGLSIHLLEAGFETRGRPCLLLLHGFPELAYSWRKVMLPLSEAGYHVIAPDQRGYGRTTGWDADYDGDLASFRLTNLVRDALGLVFALGYRSADVIGHDYGASVAAWSALIRPDVFRTVTLMSAPFSGPPQLPFDTAHKPPPPKPADLDAALAALDPPRRHYQRYYSTREANANMWRAPQGVHDFLRAYYHHKSADWTANKPHPLKAQTASELAQLPTYYIMRADKGMAETVAQEMPTPAQIAANEWLPDNELAVYASEYQRNGFQGGLQWYRNRFEPRAQAQLQLYAGRTIDVPACFISGASDWGIHQVAGALEAMQTKACTDMRGCHLVEGAGHWVQQEQPQDVVRLLLEFLKKSAD